MLPDTTNAGAACECRPGFAAWDPLVVVKKEYEVYAAQSAVSVKALVCVMRSLSGAAVSPHHCEDAHIPSAELVLLL